MSKLFEIINTDQSALGVPRKSVQLQHAISSSRIEENRGMNKNNSTHKAPRSAWKDALGDNRNNDCYKKTLSTTCYQKKYGVTETLEPKQHLALIENLLPILLVPHY